MARTLRFLVGLMGATCAAIGVYHFALGTATVAGESSADATVDSRERFYGAVFLGYGLAWLSAHRQRPISSATVRWLAGIFLLGGLGRLVSLRFAVLLNGPVRAHGHRTRTAPVFFWLADAEERARDPASTSG